MNNSPLVSIIIPVYNGSDYLAEAIDSALAQTYKNIEVLVINDGSKDNGATRDIALGYGDKIRYLEKENGGVATALNFGIKEMKGKYFSWLSHDDKYFPNKIEHQIDFLSTLNEKTAVLYSDIEYIDSHSTSIMQIKFLHYPPELFRPAFIKYGLISGCTLLVPKICFKECGLFNPTLRTTQDYDLWFRISEKFQFIHIQEILIQSRVHENQDTRKLQNIALEERDNLQLNFIESISEEEIKLFSKDNVSGYYLSFTAMMAAYFCPKAERFAFLKALKTLFKARFSIIINNLIKLIFTLFLVSVIKLFIGFFGTNKFVEFKRKISFLRLKIKNQWHSCFN
jgi:glycosyltransferase involved in cell wall biosynthesis